jgi:hypothetical protein
MVPRAQRDASVASDPLTSGGPTAARHRRVRVSGGNILMTELGFTPMSYSEVGRRAWVGGDYAMLTSSAASSYLSRVLRQKAETRRRRRATDRFFGEAYVSAKVPHLAGYYGSFRWLTNSYFVSPPAPVQAPLTDREELHRGNNIVVSPSYRGHNRLVRGFRPDFRFYPAFLKLGGNDGI